MVANPKLKVKCDGFLFDFWWLLLLLLFLPGLHLGWVSGMIIMTQIPSSGVGRQIADLN